MSGNEVRLGNGQRWSPQHFVDHGRLRFMALRRKMVGVRQALRKTGRQNV